MENVNTDIKTYQGMEFEPFITRRQIAQRVGEIARQARQDLGEQSVPLFVCVLNGAFPFASDLIRQFPGDAEITFIRYKSYEGMSSTGTMKQVLGLSEDIEGRDVVVVEDIIDTGATMKSLLADLRRHNPRSLRVATLLFKPESLKHDIHPDYVGFDIPTKFIIGYGLDLDGLARNLPDIYVLRNKGGNEQQAL